MTSLRLKTAAVIYGVLVAAAITIGIVRGAPNICIHQNGILNGYVSAVSRFSIGAAIGILLGLGVAWLTRFSVYRYHWARKLHAEFRGLFGPISGSDIFAFASISAVAEELFFRGALQPIIGIAATSIVFGIVHLAPNRHFVPWTIQALAMGFVLCGLFYLTGDLTAPILAHFTINYQNLHFINRYNPTPKLPRAFGSSIENKPSSGQLISRHPQ